MSKLCLYGIPDKELEAMRLAADLSWRGISYPAYSQVTRAEAVPKSADQGIWGRVNGAETELEASLRA